LYEWQAQDKCNPQIQKLQSFKIEKSIPFCKGKIHGYFIGEPPMEFWETQAVFVPHPSLYSVKWAEEFGKDEIEGMTKRCKDALGDYDGFQRIIPKWFS
jgi:hypothetical protein